MDKKQYLGDGVYVSYDSYQIRLTVENGLSTTNEIYMDPLVIKAFSRYIKQINDCIREITE